MREIDSKDVVPQLQIILNCSILELSGRVHAMIAISSMCRGVAVAALLLVSTVVHAAGDLSRQEPIEVTVELGKPGQHAFAPNKLRFETGKLYKLVLRNPSGDPHYFTSHAFTQLIYTRKVQVVQDREGKRTTLAEGAIREIEVYPGHIAEWWFVPELPVARRISAVASPAPTERATPGTEWWAKIVIE